MWDKVDIEPRTAVVRCYKCGSSQVSAFCHHCRRLGCAEHVRPSPRWMERLLGREGSGPGLDNVSACHCLDCAHNRSGPVGRWLAIGAGALGLAADGLIAFWLSSAVGLVLLAVGGIAAGVAFARARSDVARERAGMPVPLHPKVADVEVTEELRGEITLGGQGEDYRTVLEPVKGTISLTLTFGRPDRDRVLRRRRRTHLQDGDLRYCAGCVLLQGPFGVRAGAQIAGPLVELEGDARDRPVFRPVDAPSSSPWKFARSYQLHAEPHISTGPIWITPSIVPDSDHHGLELDVQWVEFGPNDDKPLSLRLIELLRLDFPVSWGEIHDWGILDEVSALPRATIGLVPEGRRSIELKRLSPAKPGKDAPSATRLTVSIRFRGQVDPEDEISGRLTATMRGTLSGLTGVGLFNSLGGRRRYSGAAINTRVDVSFRLSLASIRYQAMRVVPDRAAEDNDRDSFADNFAVIPDEETVIALTNAMSEEGYYVKHVIENPPRSGRRANEIQRYWDIAGRRYEGVYPIDFNIILTGEEFHSGGVRPDSGSTKVRIVVKGAYTDDEMDTRINDEHKRLRDLTSDTLRRQDSGASGQV